MTQQTGGRLVLSQRCGKRTSPVYSFFLKDSNDGTRCLLGVEVKERVAQTELIKSIFKKHLEPRLIAFFALGSQAVAPPLAEQKAEGLCSSSAQGEQRTASLGGWQTEVKVLCHWWCDTWVVLELKSWIFLPETFSMSQRRKRVKL